MSTTTRRKTTNGKKEKEKRPKQEAGEGPLVKQDTKQQQKKKPKSQENTERQAGSAENAAEARVNQCKVEAHGDAQEAEREVKRPKVENDDVPTDAAGAQVEAEEGSYFKRGQVVYENALCEAVVPV
ncbi:hypothetical protein K437DRAFT_270426 [Tilletiaria anomala UBC 951]|uniref:Uncharacterized protein n=1 Tax=Tilletiaria anomala (strain ATCC 24038 / CBS 436.72 / UBC 951) TaxID=1037660 RepID=A0A066VBW2_TILAU|nr:uncharacterized protein K437DRAFT_270426 [Tilletiaria anomala UBC 951]KDN38936.1 hypothetical protein K437DRAFT_270426 [Tilletiaria anomala UBC 951]